MEEKLPLYSGFNLFNQILIEKYLPNDIANSRTISLFLVLHSHFFRLNVLKLICKMFRCFFHLVPDTLFGST